MLTLINCQTTLCALQNCIADTGFTVYYDGSLRNTHPLIIQKPMYISLESLLTRFFSCCWNSRNLTTALPLSTAHRQILPYSSQAKACRLTT